VQMVVYLPSPLTQKPVLAGFLKGGSEDTLCFVCALLALAEGACPHALTAGPALNRPARSSASRARKSAASPHPLVRANARPPQPRENGPSPRP